MHRPNNGAIVRVSALAVFAIATALGAERAAHGPNELFEVRVFEGAPPGTKATLNEAFDRALREQSSCFAQLESDLDWLDFDPVRLVFETVAELPANQSRPAQFAVLHLLCPQHKQQSLHFSVHITRRNRHPPRFSAPEYRFYAPSTLQPGAEIGRVHVSDQDPIIYNSQVQLSAVPSTVGRLHSAGGLSPSRRGGAEEEAPWEVHRNGSVLVRRPLGDLRLFRPYPVRLLAVDFGSPQLFSLANLSVVPVSVSQPRSLRLNVASGRYQVFEWALPDYGVPERFRLALRRKGELRPLHEQEMEPADTMALSRVHLPPNVQFVATVYAVDVEGETPSEELPFQVVESELHCEGECAKGAGVPLCHYAPSHRLEQYRDAQQQRHCLCFAGFSGAQCANIEHCPAERLFEPYGGVDWPETAVNASASIPCPYNEDGKWVERRCGWDRDRERPNWADAERRATKRDSDQGPEEQQCKSQSSVLVHLGVLANYAQRSEQTLSGLQSVLRFLDSLLLFPAFDPRVPTAHFDAKIAEHVAQVLDSLAARNLSAMSGGNSTQLSAQLLAYVHEFARRLPVPFSLQSQAGGVQMRSWELFPEDSSSGTSGVQLGPCYVQPPRQSGRTPKTARATCLHSGNGTTLLPQMEGSGSPLLILEWGDSANNWTESAKLEPLGWYGASPLVLGFRLSAAATRHQENRTCAHFDAQENVWSAAEVTVLSREPRAQGQQVVLCEFRAPTLSAPGCFALLPESLFRPESALRWWLGAAAPLAGALCTMALCAGLVLVSALLCRHSDPALSVLLLSVLLLHALHSLLLLRPLVGALPGSLPWPSSPALFSVLQLALLSLSASLALLNSSVYARIIQLEMDVRKAPSRRARLLSTLSMGIVLPCALCVLCALFDGQILAGLDSGDGAQLLPFNWAFVFTLLVPAIGFLGFAMGFGGYSLYYGNSVAATCPVLATDSASLVRRRLLHQLSSAAGVTQLVLLLAYGNLLVVLQPREMIRSCVLSALYVATCLSLCLLVRLLARVQRRLPHSRENVVDVGPRALRENTLVGGGEEKAQQQMAQPVILFQSGQCQAIAPDSSMLGGMLDSNNNSPTSGALVGMEAHAMDRQFLLRRSILAHPNSHHNSKGLLPGQMVQLSPPSAPHSQHQPLSVTVSTSAGTVLLESDDLSSLDPAHQRPLPANLFAESEDNENDGDEEEEEDLNAFLEQNTDTLRPTLANGGSDSGRQRRSGTNGEQQQQQHSPLTHPLVSVV